MTKKRVLLDCDGILANFVDAAIAMINAEFGHSFTPADVTRFDIAGSLGLTPDQASLFKRRIGEIQDFARHLKPYDGAREGVALLRAVADVYIVTSPWNSNPTWMHDREWWLDKHFGIKHANVIHTSAKHVCVGDVFVDDKTEAVVQWKAAHPRGLALRWYTPHNRLDEYEGLVVQDWHSLVTMVEEWRA